MGAILIHLQRTLEGRKCRNRGHQLRDMTELDRMTQLVVGEGLLAPQPQLRRGIVSERDCLRSQTMLRGLDVTTDQKLLVAGVHAMDCGAVSSTFEDGF